MHRINTSGSSGGLFQDTTNPKTVVDAAWLNDVQESLIALLTLFGVSPIAGDYSQFAGLLSSVGLPGRKSVTNLNTLTSSGFFTSSAAATGRPSGAAAGQLISNFDFAASGDGLQIFAELAGDRVWTRRWASGAWQAWSQIGGWTAGSGYEIRPSGIIEQWGIYAGGTSAPSITFPVTYPTACENLVLTAVGASPSTQTSDHSVRLASIASVSASGFSAYGSWEDEPLDVFTAPAGGIAFHWRATGR